MKQTLDVHVTVIEQPGQISAIKAAELSRKLQQLLARPDFRAEIEARIAQKKEVESA